MAAAGRMGKVGVVGKKVCVWWWCGREGVGGGEWGNVCGKVV